MLSWSSSVGSIAVLNTWLQFAGILFIILAATCAYFLISTLKQTITVLSEKASSSSYKKQSIQDTAGNIRKELLKAKQDNDIAKIRISSLESENNDLRMKLIKADKSHEQLQDHVKKMETEKTETIEFMEPTSTGGLSTQQTEQLRQVLESGPKGNIDIYSVIGEETSRLIAESLEEMLNKEGWTTNGVAETAYSNIPEGIIFAVHSKDTAPSYSSFLQRSFSTIGLPVSGTINKKYREWSLTMIVGRISETT